MLHNADVVDFTGGFMQVVSYWTLLESGLAAFGLTLLLAAPIKRFVVTIGWLDKPNWRKLHSGTIPLAGGLMIATAVTICVLVQRLWQPPAWQMWAAAAMVFAVAFFDDRYPVRARFRLAVQVAAAVLITVSAGWRLESLGLALGPFELSLGVLSLPFTILGMAALTNAVNMTDGLDGMAGGVVSAALFWLMLGFAWIAQDIGSSALLMPSAAIASASVSVARDALAGQALVTAKALAIVIGATLGFLAFNQRLPWRHRAELFLGDGGSMMLGFLIAALCVHIVSNYGAFGMPAASIGWIVAVPLIDLFSCIVRRLRAGVTPMTPDRRHLHNLVVALGLPVSKAVPVLQGLSLLCGLIGVIGWRLNVAQHWMFWSLVGVFALYHHFALQAWKRLQPDADGVGRLLDELRMRPGAMADQSGGDAVHAAGTVEPTAAAQFNARSQ